MIQAKVTLLCSICRKKAPQAQYSQDIWPVSGSVLLDLIGALPLDWTVHQDYLLCSKCASKRVDTSPVIKPHSI